ncbi:hypothetical protein K504DRAFT_419489 [Pleomassaria siparia CBS 279.74]|uniref:Uncharacterized protein n=1 Tax=Pleomassaria siparia CBS 279.74 TaxID=1314801 RepID=A0A6G1JQP4_9PLEO|nr:hypothetical protein K504DRAFT_419489 [Pleomassaria siparia CBS 279.74]
MVMSNPWVMTPSKRLPNNGTVEYQPSSLRASGPPAGSPFRGRGNRHVDADSNKLGSHVLQGRHDGTQSSSSPEPSVSSNDTVTGNVNYSPDSQVKAVASPFRRDGEALTPSSFRIQATPSGSPEKIRHAPPTVQNVGPAIGSLPNDNHVQPTQGRSYDSPQLYQQIPRGSQGIATKHGSPLETVGQAVTRRDSNTSQSLQYTPATPNTVQKRSSVLSQGSQGPYVTPARRSANSKSNSGLARGRPGLLHPVLSTNNAMGQNMYAIPEKVGVQEFAFRRGQQDRGNTRDRIPPNQFHPGFDKVWDYYYIKGKQSHGPAILLPANPPSPSRANYDWPPLVNPYTQTPEHPHGIYDEQYARAVCDQALNAMESLVRDTCTRKGQWEKTVCDIPQPIANAIWSYPDLAQRYADLSYAAQEAVAGGLPFSL